MLRHIFVVASGGAVDVYAIAPVLPPGQTTHDAKLAHFNTEDQAHSWLGRHGFRRINNRRGQTVTGAYVQWVHVPNTDPFADPIVPSWNDVLADVLDDVTTDQDTARAA